MNSQPQTPEAPVEPKPSVWQRVVSRTQVAVETLKALGDFLRQKE